MAGETDMEPKTREVAKPVVSDGQSNAHRRWTKFLPHTRTGKRLILVGVAAVFLLTIGVLLTLLLKNRDTEQPVVSKAVSSKLDQFNQYARQGDLTKATEALQEARANASNTAERAAVENGAAQLAFNGGNLDESLKDAQASNKYEKNATAYGLIGYVATQKKDWKLAAESFAKAAELSPSSSDPTQASPYNDYKNLEKEARSHL